MSQNRVSQRIGLTIVIVSLVLALGILAAPIVLCVSLKDSEPLEIKCGPLIEDPKSGFTDITDMEWPQNAEVITFADTHSGFLCEGEFYLIFKTDQEILEEWLSEAPPWGFDEWKSGPVPPQIGSRASFGKGGMIIGRVGDGPYEYKSEGELVDFLKSHKIWYATSERCCDQDEDFYSPNGKLLIIDLDTQQVWLSIWDS